MYADMLVYTDMHMYIDTDSHTFSTYASACTHILKRTKILSSIRTYIHVLTKPQLGLSTIME